MNEEQTEHTIYLVFSVLLLIGSIISAYFWYDGTWHDLLKTETNGYGFFHLMLMVGTVLGLVFGFVFILMSAVGINEARI